MFELSFVLGYLILTVLISSYYNKKNKSIKSFLVADGKIGIIATCTLFLGDLVAGSGTIGVAATGYTTGIAGAWQNISLSLGCILLAFTTMKFYRVMFKEGKLSVAESMGHYFDERTRTVAMLITAVSYFIVYGLQPIAAAGLLAPMLGISSESAAWIISAIFIAVAVFGGLAGAAGANVLHALVIYLGMGLGALYTIKHAGGLSTMKNTLDPSYFDMAEPGIFTIIAWIGSGLNLPAASMMVNGVMGAKSAKVARSSLIVTAILLVPLGFFIVFIGMSAKASGLQIAQNTAIYEGTKAVSPYLSTLASMSIFAAIASTCPGLLMAISGTLTRDVFVKVKKNPTDKEQLYFSKIIIVIVGVASTAFGLNASSIMGNLLSAMQIRSVMAIVLVIAILWKKVDNRAAFWSLLLGGIVSAVWFFAGNPYGIEPLWPGIILAFLVEVGISIKNKNDYPKWHWLQDKYAEYGDDL